MVVDRGLLVSIIDPSSFILVPIARERIGCAAQREKA